MSRVDREYSEKRNFIRMKIDTPVNVTIDNQNTSTEGICRNLSGGGMLIVVKKELPVGAELKVTLASPHGHSPILMANAVVTRVETAGSGTCTLGVEITEILN